MGYIPLKEETIKSVETSDFHIEIAGTMAKAKISSKPLYDPISEKIRM
jgi:4-methylaminobutanoate oxidase (formaldehyde-forming)